MDGRRARASGNQFYTLRVGGPRAADRVNLHDRWAWATGEIVHQRGSEWVKRPLGTGGDQAGNRFREVRRNRQYIELHDATRYRDEGGISLRLYRGRGEAKKGRDREWRPWHDGEWQ